jgi:hypothetical protein
MNEVVAVLCSSVALEAAQFAICNSFASRKPDKSDAINYVLNQHCIVVGTIL